MDRRRLVYTVVLFLALFSLLPVAVWLEASYGWPWLFAPVFALILVGYALLWRYRLLFLGLLLLLAASGLLDAYGDQLFSLLFFIAPYGVACAAVARRVAERLSPLEWVEVGEEPGGGVEGAGPVIEERPARPRPRARREGRGGGGSETGDPCGGDELIDLLLERGENDPEVERLLREYMECRAKWLLEHFEEWEKRTGIRVGRRGV